MAGDVGAFDLAAAYSRAAQGDLQAFMEGLAARLEPALPGAVSVRRKRKNLFSGAMRTTEIAVRTEVGSMSLSLRDGRIAARRTKVVRGVAISSQEIPVPIWLDELARLVAASGESARSAHSSLREFLMS